MRQLTVVPVSVVVQLFDPAWSAADVAATGATAAMSLMGKRVPVMAERGHWLAREDGRKVLVTLHPSALLRTLPEEREAAFAAFVKDLAKARGVFK